MPRIKYLQVCSFFNIFDLCICPSQSQFTNIIAHNSTAIKLSVLSFIFSRLFLAACIDMLVFVFYAFPCIHTYVYVCSYILLRANVHIPWPSNSVIKLICCTIKSFCLIRVIYLNQNQFEKVFFLSPLQCPLQAWWYPIALIFLLHSYMNILAKTSWTLWCCQMELAQDQFKMLDAWELQSLNKMVTFKR